jgi:integrase
VKFTKDTVAALVMPAGKTDHFEWDPDLPGFGVRLRRTKRCWYCQYRVNGKQRREGLGDVRKVTLEAARKIARQRFASVELGVDPRAARDKASAAAAATKLTLAVAAERYLAVKQHTLRPASYAAAQRYFTSHWAPLAARPLGGIGRADVAGQLQVIVKDRGRVGASRARANLSGLFTWATKEGLCDTNPVAITNDPGAGIKPRERVLDAGEIKAIWDACDDDGDFSVIVKLLILTSQRRNEIADLRWSTEIDFNAGLIKLPASRTKNAHPHNIPMAGAVIGILAARLEHRGNARDLLFGRRGRSFTTWTNSKAKLDRKIAATGKALAPWTLHDVRRSAATHMGEIGVEPHVIEAILNHRSGFRRGIAAVYNRSSYDRAMKAALARWAERVLDIVEERETKIVPLHSAR